MDHRELPFGGVRRLGRQVNVLLVVTVLVAAAFGLADVLSDNRATAQTGSGDAEYFLQIDGIPGESLDAAHRDQIELLSYEWSGDGKPGVELPPTGGAGSGTGNATGKPQANAIHFSQNVSRASPLLLAATAGAKHYAQATLFVRKSGETPQEYLTIKLTDVLVTSYRTGAVSPAAPTDEFTLSFGKVEYSYKPQRADGTLGPPIVGTWDFRTNTGG